MTSPHQDTDSSIQRNSSAILFGSDSAATGSSSTDMGINENTPLLASKGDQTKQRQINNLPNWNESSNTSDNGSIKIDESDDGRKKPKGKSSSLQYAAKLKQRSKYYVPITDWLPNYSWSLFSGDLIAGLSVACLLIPQSMSYASGLARLSPLAGLWSTAIPALAYGALGTCRQLSIGPEASLSLLMGQMIQDAVLGNPHHKSKHPEFNAAALSVITTFQIGLITSILGLLRLGFLDVVLSRALLHGFITAVAIIIFIAQMIPMLGMEYILSHPENSENAPNLPLDKLIFTLKHLDHINKPTMILSFTSLGFLILARVAKQQIVKRPGGTWVRYIPEILVLCVTSTILSAVLKWEAIGIDILGQIKGEAALPFGWPLNKRALKYFNYTFPTAFVSAVIGVVDSIVAARENAMKYGYAVSPNRELVALGATNLASSFLTVTGCIPIFGSITRSRLNGQTGGRTQMSSMISSGAIILAIYFLLPYLYFLPKATLAVIITLVVYSILAEAPHEIMYFYKMKAWTDFMQMTGTFILTLFFSMEIGLVASVVLSLILVVQKSSQPRIQIIGRVPDSDQWAPVDEEENAHEEIPGVLVVRIRESLSFANTGQLKERLRRLELYGHKKSHPSDEPRRESAKALIMHMGEVQEIDASGIQILYELSRAYHERGVAVHFASIKSGQIDKFKIVGLTELLGPSHFHANLQEAMKEVESMGYGTSVFSRFS
ncbi:uncharacterized protein L201_002997 [Kwoniella dendrophila CBS 6074]|uniref:STAS domain-containing protein n=1 Tax=Kwoniella dendrophila CBS 6074 TaxID=1295534 RepID=A0AAX4JUB5_9TREE